MLHDGGAVANGELHVTALAALGIENEIQPILPSVTPSAPHEFAAIHLVMLAHNPHPS